MAANGYFIRELAAAAAFIPALAFAVEDDVGPDSYHVTGTQVESYFDTKYAPVSGGAYVAWNSTSGLATSIATGSRILIGDATTGASLTATDSILIGQEAGQDLTSGANCLAIGYQAMAENVTGARSICIGNTAGKGVAGNSHDDSVFIGFGVGESIETGFRNVGVGSYSLAGVTTGWANVSIGHGAGRYITTGRNNMSIGTGACNSVISGQGNVAVGISALEQGNHNYRVGIGYQAGLKAGGEAVFIGAFCAKSCTQVACVGIGSFALSGLTTGGRNVAVGKQAGSQNVTGARNTYIGEDAGKGVVGNSHSDNGFFGDKAGFAVTTGSSNTFVGGESGIGITSGGSSAFVGYRAGGVFTSGAANVCIGYQVGYTAPSATSSNQLFIDNADVDEDNVIVYAEMDNHVMKLNADVRITEPGVETADAEGQLDVIQTDTAGAQPVLVLDQDDISEEFIKFYGSAAAATITQSLVAAADVTTATVNGYIRVNVQDEGNQITDGAYYLPVYALT